MRYNRFLESHLLNILNNFDAGKDKADIFLKKYFKGTNLGKRDRTWIRDRFFFYMRHRLLFDRIMEMRTDLCVVIAMLYENEPDEELNKLIDEIKKKGEFDILFDHSFPIFLKNKIKEMYGDKYYKWFNSQSEIVLRTNFRKIEKETLMSKLSEDGYSVFPTEISPAGIIVENSSSNLKNSPLFQNGLFEFQDESSQLATLLINRTFNTFFDACAGSGGKSLAAATFFPHIQITISDIREHLFKEIRSRSKRSGTVIDTIKYQETEDKLFDTVFIDAPCSGSGVLRRNPCDLSLIHI